MGSDCRALGGFGLRAYQKGAGDLRALSPAREFLILRHGARQQFTKLDISLLPSAGKIGLPRIQGICGILWATYINAQQVPSPPPSPILLGPRRTSRRRTPNLPSRVLAAGPAGAAPFSFGTNLPDQSSRRIGAADSSLRSTLSSRTPPVSVSGGTGRIRTQRHRICYPFVDAGRTRLANKDGNRARKEEVSKFLFMIRDVF